MGRTKRKRRLLKKFRTQNASHDQHLISLQRWLLEKKWTNSNKLTIRCFIETGRGLTSKKSILPYDTLICMPLNLMITFKSIQMDFPLKDKLLMHELLALFLVTEKLKREESKWHYYIESLPEDIPPLPWLASSEEINTFPLDLRSVAENIALNLKKFLGKLRSIKNTSFILNDHICTWAYVMVNTRAVYVDPSFTSDQTSRDLLLDQPSLALCPFLDMFNHHFLAHTEANIVQNGDELVYQLKSLTGFKKKKQVFISYGQHDNNKLLMEYGFFIPMNCLDTIKFEFEDILRVLKLSLDNKRYTFIREHNFHKELYLGFDGVSYCLKIVLFVGFSKDFKFFNSIVFSDSYPEYFTEKHLPIYVRTLLDFKIEMFKNELMILSINEIVSDSVRNVIEYVKYRIQLAGELRRKY